MKIYKQQGKTWNHPADSLRDTFSRKEFNFLYDVCRYNVNRNNYLFSIKTYMTGTGAWVEFHKIDDFLVTFYELLNGNKLNLDDKDYKLLYKIIDKIACIRYRNILANKSEYQALLDRQWIG